MSKIQLVWLDYETGGLNGRLDNGALGMEHYPILEVAIIVTDSELNQLGEPLRLVIHQSEQAIAKCDPWALDAHTKSGLIDEVRQSGLSTNEAEAVILTHLKGLGIDAFNRKEQTGAILVGSSVTFDRTYMIAQMPKLNEYLHYRQLDVSAINVACRFFRPDVAALVKKECKHEALADIQETIAELKLYRDSIFRAAGAEVMNFVNAMIGAFESGFVETHQSTLADLYRCASVHVKDNYDYAAPTLVDAWGEDVAQLCKSGDQL